MKFRILSTLMVVPLLLNQLSSCGEAVFRAAILMGFYSSAELKALANVPRIEVSVRELGTAANANLKIKVKVPGPPYPKRVEVMWKKEGLVKNLSPSHSEYITGRGVNGLDTYTYIFWTIPVNQDTGEVPELNLTYEDVPNTDEQRRDFIQALDPDGGNYLSDVEELSINRNTGQSSTAWLEAQSAPPIASQDDPYYFWQVWLHVLPVEQETMNSSSCKEYMSVLQDGRTFFAMRSPPSSSSPDNTTFYTYTLPLATGPITYTPHLTLKYSTFPYTSVITVPLELKAGYQGFFAEKMPKADGEHWLALGAVTTPTVDCNSVPSMGTKWMFEAEFWLDLGGTAQAGAGRQYPLYTCYKGQNPPASQAQQALSFQDWGITCLGPQPISLGGSAPRIELEYSFTKWITSTQTITFYHQIRNWSGVTRTLTITHSSTPNLPWQLYTAFESDPNTKVPITQPIQLPSSFYKVRPIWAVITVPKNTPDGAATLVITATDTTEAAISSWTSDLLWIGNWVAPPPAPYNIFLLFLPLLRR